MNETGKFLSEQEKELVRIFFENEAMREAVKKVLLFGIYNNGSLQKDVPADPMRNFLIGLALNNPLASNEALGVDLRGSVQGINILENAFEQMSHFKREEMIIPKKNEAR